MAFVLSRLEMIVLVWAFVDLESAVDKIGFGPFRLFPYLGAFCWGCSLHLMVVCLPGLLWAVL